MRMSALKRIRTEVFHVSQSDLAKIAGVTQATVSRWESGEFGPSLGELQRIRDEARARELAWDDSLFFAETPDQTIQAAE